jgi:hypothetical protein
MTDPNLLEDAVEAVPATIAVKVAFGNVAIVFEEGTMVLDPDTADRLADGLRKVARAARLSKPMALS